MAQQKKSPAELEKEGWKPASITGGTHLQRTLEMYEELGLEVHLEETSPEESSLCTVCYEKSHEPRFQVYTRGAQIETDQASGECDNMPLYEYQCTACKAKFEKRCSLENTEEEKDLTCPSCGAKSPERLLSTFVAGGSAEGSCAPKGGG